MFHDPIATLNLPGSLADPSPNAPPYNQTKLGSSSGLSVAGPHILIVRQSSDSPVVGPVFSELITLYLNCTQLFPNLVASMVDELFDDGRGFGGLNLKSPTGGCAYGIPKNARIDLWGLNPSTIPEDVSTSSGRSFPAKTIGINRWNRRENVVKNCIFRIGCVFHEGKGKEHANRKVTTQELRGGLDFPTPLVGGTNSFYNY